MSSRAVQPLWGRVWKALALGSGFHPGHCGSRAVLASGHRIALLGQVGKVLLSPKCQQWAGKKEQVFLSEQWLDCLTRSTAGLSSAFISPGRPGERSGANGCIDCVTARQQTWSSLPKRVLHPRNKQTSTSQLKL